MSSMKLLSGSANPRLATQISQQLKIEQLAVQIAKFANGEKRVWIQDETKIRGQNVVIVQSFSHPTDEHIMEFLLLCDALERLGVRHINAVIPWMGYSFQDKVFRPGEPIAAKVVANLISTAHVKRAFLLDLHNSSTPGFFSIPTEHLSAMPVFVKYVQEHFDLASAAIASPDFGGLKRARVFADKLGLDLVKIDKHRDLGSGQVTAKGIQGEVANKTVIIFDDAILSGSTVIEAATILKEHGASKVVFLASHGLFVNKAHQRLQDSPVDQVVITDSIAQTQKFEKLTVLDIAEVFVDSLQDWM